jgi:hypothetical protein
VVLCGSVNMYQRFREPCCLLLQVSPKFWYLCYAALRARSLQQLKWEPYISQYEFCFPVCSLQNNGHGRWLQKWIIEWYVGPSMSEMTIVAIFIAVTVVNSTCIGKHLDDMFYGCGTKLRFSCSVCGLRVCWRYMLTKHVIAVCCVLKDVAECSVPLM